MTTARRYTAAEAVAGAIVDRAVDEDAVRRTAVEIAAAQADKAGSTLGTIKARMYAATLKKAERYWR